MQLFSNAKQVIKYFDELYGKKTYEQFRRYEKLISRFKKQFKSKKCYIASSSGRVEIVGNHTDHNGGKVIGSAIDLDIAAAFLPNADNVVKIYSKGSLPIVFSVGDSNIRDGGSVGMVKGVIEYFKLNGFKVGGFNAYTHSVLPSGSGISSSAAFSVLFAAILSGLYNGGEISCEHLAKAGQYAENVYYGKPCGLLDQSVVAFGGVVALDFKNGVECRKIVSDFKNISLILVNTGKSHSNLTGLYASIPSDMKLAANCLGCERLIDVEPQKFLENYDKISLNSGESAALRAKHFFEENVRVEDAETALKNNDVKTFIGIINASGDSSRYQIKNCSADENDTSIAEVYDYVRKTFPFAGVRVHGGGFAGTVLCVVPSENANKVLSALRVKFGDSKVMSMRIRSAGSTALG